MHLTGRGSCEDWHSNLWWSVTLSNLAGSERGGCSQKFWSLAPTGRFVTACWTFVAGFTKDNWLTQETSFTYFNLHFWWQVHTPGLISFFCESLGVVGTTFTTTEFTSIFGEKKCSLSLLVSVACSRPAVLSVKPLHSNCHLHDCWPWLVGMKS